MKVALVHDWVVTLGGAERCLEVFHEMFPEAPLYTLVFKDESIQKLGFDPTAVSASFLQRYPKAQTWYQKYLPLYPMAIEGLDVTQHDIVLSSSHVAAKGVITRSDQLHICYCHTPVRYAWDMTFEYLDQQRLTRGLKGFVTQAVLNYIRLWDISTANRVDHFIANSEYVARRIWRTYRRKAEVIYPPVDVERFYPDHSRDEYFLFVSRLVPYKRAELVVRAFNTLGLPLVVIGDGPDRPILEQLAGSNVTIMGWQSDDVVKRYMERARAVVFPAKEDFGIVPVEAQAAGSPVIAFGEGGCAETVIPYTGDNIDRATGIHFYEQTEEMLRDAVLRFTEVEHRLSRAVIRQHAEHFRTRRFRNEMESSIEKNYESFKKKDAIWG